MKTFYLLAAIVGAIVPYIFFFQFFAENSALGFVPALFVNGAAAGFSADLLITSFVFWVFMWGRRGAGPTPWPFVLLNLAIGLSCAFPAYLYASARRSAS